MHSCRYCIGRERESWGRLSRGKKPCCRLLTTAAERPKRLRNGQRLSGYPTQPTRCRYSIPPLPSKCPISERWNCGAQLPSSVTAADADGDGLIDKEEVHARPICDPLALLATPLSHPTQPRTWLMLSLHAVVACCRCTPVIGSLRHSSHRLAAVRRAPEPPPRRQMPFLCCYHSAA